MIERFRQGKLIWVNLKDPSTEEVQTIMSELDIPPALMTDLTSVVPKNGVSRSEDTIKITLDFPVIKRLDVDHQFEVKFLVSKKSLLTVQYEEMEGIDRFKRQFEVATTLRKHQKGLTGAHIFISLFNSLYDSTFSKLDYIETKLAEIESEIFKNNEKHMVFEISSISKRLIAFRHTIRGHETIYPDLKKYFNQVYGETFESELQNLHNLYVVIQHKTNTQYETLSALRETNSAMLTTKQNEIIKKLSIMAFITFPLALFSSMFGMNTHGTPIIGNKHDFWIIVGIMVMVTISFFTFFKRKGWI
jgi:magnesium transporter